MAILAPALAHSSGARHDGSLRSQALGSIWLLRTDAPAVGFSVRKALRKLQVPN